MPAGVARGPHLAARRVVADDERFVTCAGCGKTLAAIAGGCFVERHKGRTSVYPCPAISIQCEACGALWVNPTLVPHPAQISLLAAVLETAVAAALVAVAESSALPVPSRLPLGPGPADGSRGRG